MADENRTPETTGQESKFTWSEGDVQITQPEETQEQQVQEERVTEAPKAHWRTVKAPDLALMKATISQESHAAVLEGRISLDQARKLGREAGPDGPVGAKAEPAKPKKADKKDRSRLCLCGCGELTAGGVWRMGHDARLPGLVLLAVQGDIELTDEQREHAERRDLFAKAEAKIAAQKAKDEAKVAKEDARKQERAEKKAKAGAKQNQK